MNKSINDSVVNSVRSSVWDSVGISVWDSVGISVGISVRNSVRNSAWNSVGSPVKSSVRELIQEMNYGPGAHAANPVGDIKYSTNKYKVIHYKWISLECVMNRHNFYAQRMSQNNKQHGWGIQYYWTNERLTEVYKSLLPDLINVL